MPLLLPIAGPALALLVVGAIFRAAWRTFIGSEPYP